MRGADIFDGLSQVEMGAIRHMRRYRELAAKENLFWEGHPASGLYIVLSGKLEIYREEEDGKVSLGLVGANQMIGEMGLLLQSKTRSAGAQAVVPSVVMEIPRDPLELFREIKHYSATIKLLQNLFQSLAQRLEKKDRQEVRRFRAAVREALGYEASPKKALAAIEKSLPKRGIFKKIVKEFTLKPGATLIAEGDASDGFYFIRSGALEVTQKALKGASKRLGKIEGPCLAGEIGFFAQKRRSATLRAITETRYHFFPESEFEKLKKSDSEAALSVIFAAAQLTALLILERESTTKK